MDDIDLALDDALRLDQTLVDIGFQQGAKLGQTQGAEQGKLLAIQQGTAWGRKLGRYSARVNLLLALAENQDDKCDHR